MPFGAALSICSEGYLRAAVLPLSPTPFFAILLSFKNFFRARSDPAAVPAAAAVKRILKGYLSWLEEWNFRP